MHLVARPYSFILWNRKKGILNSKNLHGVSCYELKWIWIGPGIKESAYYKYFSFYPVPGCCCRLLLNKTLRANCGIAIVFRPWSEAIYSTSYFWAECLSRQHFKNILRTGFSNSDISCANFHFGWISVKCQHLNSMNVRPLTFGFSVTKWGFSWKPIGCGGTFINIFFIFPVSLLLVVFLLVEIYWKSKQNPAWSDTNFFTSSLTKRDNVQSFKSLWQTLAVVG